VTVPADETSAELSAEPLVIDPGVLTASDDAPQRGWRRLSPRMLLVHPIQEIRRAFVPIILVLVVGRGDRNLWPLIGVAVVVLVGLTRWFTTTYRVTPTQVQVKHGLLSRSTLSVPRDRVRTVDVTSHLMHRLLGLARLDIGTGQSDRRKQDGLRLDALTATAAARLHDELLHDRDLVEAHPELAEDAPEPVRPERVIATLKPSWVRFAPFTLSGLVTLGVAAGFLANLARQAQVDLGHVGAVETARHDIARLPLWGAAVVGVVVLMIVVAVLSAAGYLLTFYGFRLARQGGTVHIRRGLLTTRATTIEARRLQGAEVSEPLLLRWVRGARATAITTGLRVGRGAERGGTVLLPAAPSAETARVVADVLGTVAPVTAGLVAHGPAARRRRYTRALSMAALATLGALALWRFAGWPVGVPIVVAFALPLAVPLAADRYASLGHALADGYLVTRFGSLVRRRYMIGDSAVIGWNEQRSFFQRRAGLVTLVATSAAGRQRFDVFDVPAAEAVALADRLTPGLLTPFLLSATPGSPESGESHT
jgi:putative membrane protein